MLIFKYASISLTSNGKSADRHPMKKHYIKAQQLLDDSFKLAWQVYESGYRPNYIVGVWRGGAPIGIAVQEFLDVLGVESDHIAIRTSSYTGIGQRSKKVKVHGLSYIIRQLESEDSLLIVDDVHDTGLSIEQTIQDLTNACKKNTPEIRVATPYFKPKNNKTDSVPDYYIHETNEWLVFPHELHGLSADEIRQHKPELAGLIEKMAPIIENQ
jgi:hypoxanthine phosphoribosyltransferase